MFITFEGPDGSGKTTALEKLSEILTKQNVDFILTREPGDEKSWGAKKIRELIISKESDISSMTEAILFAADRRLHLENLIWPALKSGKIVLCDRYFDSSFAYQGKARGLGIEKIIKLNENITDNTYPDLTIYFDLPLDVALKRVDARGEQNRLDAEGIEFHRLVREGYKEMINKDASRYRVIKADKSPDEIVEQLVDVLRSEKIIKF